ncbi:MAG: carbohydrate ABC transporter permease [Lachnospiraceae bacterium]|nr:carbohydrate ABC transporter permease [Lachnospiraceae bacterium]
MAKKEKQIEQEVAAGARMVRHVHAFDIILFIVLSLLALVIIYPFYNTILVSIVPQVDYTRHPFMLIPSRVTWENYDFVFDSPLLLRSLRNSVILAVVGTLYNMVLTVLLAYTFTKRDLPGRNFFRFLLVFTMYFGGGLVPTYLLYKALGLVGNWWVMVLPTGVSITYMLIISSNMSELPSEIEESARIDGANDIQVLLRIILPLIKPILATFTIYYAVERWNEWYNAMLYLKDSKLWPLQLSLRAIISSASFVSTASFTGDTRPPLYGEGIKMACIVVTVFPLMLLYPFLQRYFLTGLTLGAVKG